jgi:hypothetical protein
MKIYTDYENIKKQIDRGMKKYFPNFYNFADLVPAEEKSLELAKDFQSDIAYGKVFKIDYKHPKKELLDQYIDKLTKVIRFYRKNIKNLNIDNYRYLNLTQIIFSEIIFSSFNSLFPTESLINYIIFDVRSYNTRYVLHFAQAFPFPVLKNLVEAIYEYVKFGYGVLEHIDLKEQIENLNKLQDLLKNLINKEFDKLTKNPVNLKLFFPTPEAKYSLSRDIEIFPTARITDIKISFFDINGIQLFHLDNNLSVKKIYPDHIEEFSNTKDSIFCTFNNIYSKSNESNSVLKPFYEKGYYLIRKSDFFHKDKKAYNELKNIVLFTSKKMNLRQKIRKKI